MSAEGIYSANGYFQANGFSVAKGFSLIEIMIVVLIIGISASMAVLYIDNSDDRLKSEARRLLAMAQFARDDAIVSGQSRAMIIDEGEDGAEYFFLRLEQGKWVKFTHKPYTLIKFSHDIKLRSVLAGKAPKLKIKAADKKNLIYFLPTGETSEFQIWINNKNSQYILRSTILGELSLKKSESS